MAEDAQIFRWRKRAFVTKRIFILTVLFYLWFIMIIDFVKRLSSICLLILIYYCLLIQYIWYFSRLSNFCFFGTSFRSQNIRNTQIIYPLWCYMNLFKWEKMTDAIKKYRFPYFCKYCETQKIRIYRIFKFFATKKVIYKSMWWSNG